MLAGLCPGTSCVAAATGRLDGLAVMAGLVLGIRVFDVAPDSLDQVYASTAFGPITLPDMLHLPRGVAGRPRHRHRVGDLRGVAPIRESQVMTAHASRIVAAVVPGGVFDVRSPEAGTLMPAVDRVGELRPREFARLDRDRIAYLDYTGAALYPASLVRRDARRLLSCVRGNPHAESGPSTASTAAVERARALTLEFVHADPALYDVVFTANASGAIRIVAEAFPFARGSRLVLTADNHNSVNGLAWPARRAGAEVAFVPLAASLRSDDPSDALISPSAASLFAFPAQSNFSGVRHPLEWVRTAQARGYRVLLDAASFAPSMPLDLRSVPADFVALSFYKIFGYPTGVGALIARREGLAGLRRRYFAGGTVDAVSMPHGVVRRKPDAPGFEDGTASFLAMDAVSDGLRWMARVGMSAAARHTARR